MIESSSSRRLLVEGPDDKWSVINLCKSAGHDWDTPDPRLPYIEDCEGYPSLRERANSTLFKSLHVVGIIIDANSEPAQRWQSMRDRLAQAGILLPERPVAGGWIDTQATPRCACGVWMMPDNSTPGMLEDFLRALVPSQDPCWAHAETATDEAIRLGARVPAGARTKAAMHAWLAWQEKPGQPLGQAITARVLQPGGELAARFLAWFDRLFT